MLNKFLLFLIIATIPLLSPVLCFAYSLGTHENITNRSIYTLDYPDIELSKKLDKYYGAIKDANLAEDNAPNWLKHFYNPATGLGLLGSLETAKFRAEGFYNDALYYYLKGNEGYAGIE